MSEQVSKVDEIFSGKIEALLEKGVAPWMMPWTATDGGRTRSVHGHEYRGINSLMTAMHMLEGNFQDPRFITKNQIGKMGGRIRTGESPMIVLLSKPVTKEDKNGDERTFWLKRYYKVWNVEQVEGLNLKPLNLGKGELEFSPDEKAEQILADWQDKPAYQEQGASAFYSPKNDTVVMPPRETFKGSEYFYSTLFHEYIHSTGHKSRLDRLDGSKFGSQSYAREELCAEIGACMLMSMCGLERSHTLENSAAYCESWLQKLRNDRSLLVKAAGWAQKAVDHILGKVWENSEEGAEKEPATA